MNLFDGNNPQQVYRSLISSWIATFLFRNFRCVKNLKNFNGFFGVIMILELQKKKSFLT